MKKGKMYYVNFTELIKELDSSFDYFYCFGEEMANNRGDKLTILSRNDTRIRDFKQLTEKDYKNVSDMLGYEMRLKNKYKLYKFKRELDEI
jgi:hypothetical protein